MQPDRLLWNLLWHSQQLPLLQIREVSALLLECLAYSCRRHISAVPTAVARSLSLCVCSEHL